MKKVYLIPKFKNVLDNLIEINTLNAFISIEEYNKRNECSNLQCFNYQNLVIFTDEIYLDSIFKIENNQIYLLIKYDKKCKPRAICAAYEKEKDDYYITQNVMFVMDKFFN